MDFGAPHLPQHDPFHRSDVERRMQTSPGHRDHGLGRRLHALNPVEIAIAGAVVVGIGLAALFWAVL